MSEISDSTFLVGFETDSYYKDEKFWGAFSLKKAFLALGELPLGTRVLNYMVTTKLNQTSDFQVLASQIDRMKLKDPQLG